MNIFIGILGCVGGFFYLKYSAKIHDMFGSIGWAERYLGAGGTYLLHKLIGLLIIVLSILYAFGALQTSAENNLGQFF